ncbi:hypothetical protein [Chelatococcus reniformis]|uniref:Uncharacterized protein n=1 Tax=Chelatococcus reniformis TaxID=1494448 RepID=A0A916U4U3_9HYPH|nr:hypothetical protein [Chelatococcus reniformis]GGC60356.1 hypothetical protein GCM10010994_18730 [Chelatococcus reniformis]
MVWLQLTNTSDESVTVNMDCVTHFQAAGLLTRLSFGFSDGTKAQQRQFHVKETPEQITDWLGASGIEVRRR